MVDDIEVMVIRSSGGTVECGGRPMAAESPPVPAAMDPAHAGGTVIGKRYVDADGGWELLCVKPGGASLSIDGVPLSTKDAKPLPASD